jgi:hemoglobin-like flavoprotein
MDIHESVERIMQSQEVFGDAFYEVFLKKYPEVQEHFEGSDMKRQSLVLTMAVSLIEQYSSYGYPATEKYLKYLGTQHRKRAISKELYPKWRNAMLETLQRFLGEEWSEELANEWQAAFEKCIKVFFEGYEENFTV